MTEEPKSEPEGVALFKGRKAKPEAGVKPSSSTDGKRVAKTSVEISPGNKTTRYKVIRCFDETS